MVVCVVSTLVVSVDDPFMETFPCLAFAIRSLNAFPWLADQALASKSLAMIDEPPLAALPPLFAASPPCVRSHVSRSRSSSAWLLGTRASQFAFQRFIHSVWRRWRSCLGPQWGIPSSRSFFRRALSLSSA